MADPNVSKNEFDEVRSTLASKGFDKTQRDKVGMIFGADIGEPGVQAGISKHELEDRVKWMRANKSQHGLSDKKIDEVERTLREKL